MTAPRSTPTGSALHHVDWGRTVYAEALRQQEEQVAQRIAGEAPDTLVFTEHDPVFTLGLRGGSNRHLLWNEEQRAQAGVALAHTNRGGDVTYHGPGQIVGYPILSLERRKDLHAYLRFLEEILIETLRRFRLEAGRREGLTGIWIGPRKIAALGVAVRRWVSYHGFALNVQVDLAHFEGIVPCGIDAAQGTVTSMHRELGHDVDIAAVKHALTDTFAARWPEWIQPAGK